MKLTESMLKQIVKEELRKHLDEQEQQPAVQQKDVYLNKYDVINPAGFKRKQLKEFITQLYHDKTDALAKAVAGSVATMEHLINKPVIQNGKDNPEWEKAVNASLVMAKGQNVLPIMRGLDKVLNGELSKTIEGELKQPEDGLLARATAVELIHLGLTL